MGEKHKQAQEYAMASVSEALKDIDFPLSKEILLDRYGDRIIFQKNNRKIALKEVLYELDENYFDSLADIENDIRNEYKFPKT